MVKTFTTTLGKNVSPASTSSTPTLNPSQSSALASVYSVLSADPALATSLSDPNGGLLSNSSNFNMTTLQWDGFLAQANSSTRGCYSNATAPMPLADKDICNLGFYCE